jgi:NAD-dependent SIR2 family protein deacetylase
MKIQLMADMIRSSTNLIAYTGAGISTSAGIGDYASGKDINTRIAQRTSSTSSSSSSQQKPKVIGPYDHLPTFAHFAITKLHTLGYLKKWFQQNHDGLPQKAGCPQYLLNEIHGAWFDPSNPVVKMSGQLRSDLFEELLSYEETADVCIAVGTSLSGMNADRLVQTCGERAIESYRKLSKANKGTFRQGSIIIGYQCTRLDEYASLRIYSTIDKVFEALMEVLGVPSGEVIGKVFSLPNHIQQLLQQGTINEELTHGRVVGDDIFEIYGYHPKTGHRQSKEKALSTTETSSNSVSTRSSGILSFLTGSNNNAVTAATTQTKKALSHSFTLDLRDGAKVVITCGPYAGSVGEVIGKTKLGDYRIRFQVPTEGPHLGNQNPKEEEKGTSSTSKDGRVIKKIATIPWSAVLGTWWILGAMRGELAYCPIGPYIATTTASSTK